MNSFAEKWKEIWKRLYKNEWLQNLSKRNIILNNFSVLDLVKRSISHVKGHRRGGVCVLWILLVLICLLISTDYSIPSEVNVALAIFVLPLNSALNPFLYTLNILMKRRRQTMMKKLSTSIEARLRTEMLKKWKFKLSKSGAVA